MVSARFYVHWSDMTETVCKCISVEFASGSKIPLVGRWGVVFSSSRLYPKDNYHQASAWGMSEMAALPVPIFSALNNGIIFIIYRLFQNLKWVVLLSKDIALSIDLIVAWWWYIIDLVDIDSGHGLVPDGTKPWPEPVMTYHYLDP